MNTKKHTIETMKDFFRILLATVGMALMLTLAGPLALSAGDDGASKTQQAKVDAIPRPGQHQQMSPETPASAVKEIRLAFKLDPRLTRSLHLGDRWVAPSVYVRVGESKEVTVETRVQSVDAKGRAVDIDAQWTASDPEMVTVTPATGPKRRGRHFNITVRHAGETILKVASQNITKELLVKAIPKGNVIQVEISPSKTDADAQKAEKTPATRR